MIASLVLGVLAVKSKENGLLKYIGMLVIAFVILGLALIPVFIGIFGFREP